MSTAVPTPQILVVCKRCGASSARVGAKFCPACGASFQKSPAGLWIFVFAVVVAMVLVFVGLFTVHTVPSPAQGVRQTVIGVGVDLSSQPAALLGDGPRAEQMSLSGLSVGSPLSTDERIDGNEFLVADGRVSQIAIGRADLLRACQVHSDRDISYRFGQPTAVQRDGPYVLYDYARRGVTVEWDSRDRRLNRVILRPSLAD